MSEKELFRTGPSMRRTYISTFFYASILLLARFATGLDHLTSLILLGVLGILLLRLVQVLVRESFVSYVITDQGVELHQGMISRKLKKAPWLRITNFSVEQSTLEHLLGLSNVRIDTPGHDQWEIEFRSLSQEATDQIVALLEEYMPDAKGPEADASAETPVK